MPGSAGRFTNPLLRRDHRPDKKSQHCLLRSNLGAIKLDPFDYPLRVSTAEDVARTLLATDQPLARLRGPLHHYGPGQTPLLVTYHPAYLLRSPREKAKSWQDLKGIWQRINGVPG